MFHYKRKIGLPRFDCFDLGVYAIPVIRYGRKFFREPSIALYPVFGQKIYRPCRLFQVVQFCPMREPRALLCFEIVLNINEQADTTVTLFWLTGRGDPHGDGFLRVVDPQRFHTREPFLIGSAARDKFSALDFVSFAFQTG